LQELTAAEVAEALNLPVNTVYTRQFHARDRLRQCLEAHGVRQPGGARP
jgi:DNA-directed RNA polymerase specialized sigma24 family protein